jgi:hypothetical protein
MDMTSVMGGTAWRFAPNEGGGFGREKKYRGIQIPNHPSDFSEGWL